MKIVRAYWTGGFIGDTTWEQMEEIPKTPQFPDMEVVYCWGQENMDKIAALGYEVRLVEDMRFSENRHIMGRKLIALNEALKEFGEVLLLDWDAEVVKPLDDEFFAHMAAKQTQCPLYAHPVDKIGWKHELGGVIVPNFGFFYTRDPEMGEKLIAVAEENDLNGCVEEDAFFLLCNKTLDEYIEDHAPVVLHGVDMGSLPKDHWYKDKAAQARVIALIKKKLKMDIYIKHK